MKSEDIVQQILENEFQFQVTKLPESEDKTPDLLAQGPRFTYLIEVKDKLPDLEKAAERESTLASGKIYEEVEGTGRTNRYARLIRRACKQLRAYPDDADFRLLWFHARGPDVELQARQMYGTLYGDLYIIDIERSVPTMPAFYFDYNEFYLNRDILDAAVIAEGRLVQLCLNTFSERYTSILESRLIERFGTAVVDPIAEEKAGKAYLADFDCSRRDRAEVLRRLQSKYEKPGLNYMEMNQFSAEIAVPNPFQKKDGT